jgi:hypothetical protein
MDLEEQPGLEVDGLPELPDDEDIIPSVPRADQFWPPARTPPVARERPPLGYRSRLTEMRPLDLGTCPVIVDVLWLR